MKNYLLIENFNSAHVTDTDVHRLDESELLEKINQVAKGCEPDEAQEFVDKYFIVIDLGINERQRVMVNLEVVSCELEDY